MMVDEEEPVPSPGDVARDLSVAGDIDLYVRCAAIAWDIINGYIASLVEDGIDFADRRFDSVRAGLDAVHVGKRGD